ncbi:hypothetical protein LGL55_10455 [Clostridium tagluense]|nr:hypothetical protein [Clostridium tagluense]MCB2300629.1 hypothetical protein [Clostridium tagluense]MCB2311640.1 hypothetical protein [Clostridium tagluense]MCB2316364.1 hypothetical protein [Clostridium tagluense]MCB2321252.1 hypothetical protein [Clostridium tagluense]MCB2326233.1 hypothetical protein [Clostridium tagluense]
MNNKTRRNLKRVVAGGVMALTLVAVVPSKEVLATDSPIVWSIKQPQVSK